MPRYDYVCDSCGIVAEEFCTISKYRSKIPCLDCDDGTMMRRDFTRGTPATLDTAFQHPIEMYSVAPETPHELAAFRQRNPGVKLNDQLVPIAHSRAEKLRILRNEGYEEKN